MGSPSRSVALAALFALLAPSAASAQGAAPGGTAAPPPPGGARAASAAGPAGDAPSAAGADDKKAPASNGNVGGVSFNDTPTRRAPQARVLRRSGPLATFPGFEALPDGGSRLFVQLSQAVPVEERRAAGSVTYVLKGAHLRVHNDSNALVTVHFNTPVFRARLVPQGNDLLFILELRGAATPTFKMNANQDKTSTLQIDFAKGDFLSGDGSESLPAESKPRALGKGAKAPKGTPRTPPPADDNTNP